MLDVAALPIAFALTLWDAAPIFLSVGTAMIIVLRVTLSQSRFSRLWHVRDSFAAGGFVYALAFEPMIAPILAVSSIALMVTSLRSSPEVQSITATPGQIVRWSAESLVTALLISSAAGALVKVASPDVPEEFVVNYGIAAIIGGLVSFRSGAIAIPAVAMAAHIGGFGPAIVCIVAAGIRQGLTAHASGHHVEQPAELA